MKRIEELPRNVRNFLKTSPRVARALYHYTPNGIVINYGPWEGQDLVKLWKDDAENVERFFENIFDADSAPIRLIMDTVEVYEDLKRNHSNYGL
jgi:hypothetical protein